MPAAKAPERTNRDDLAPTWTPPTGIVIRSAADSDISGIEQLVRDVVREVYGELFRGEAPPPAGRWECSLVAESDRRIIGAVVADDDWIEDLWVAKGHRGCGIGSVLLAAAERQIAARGHAEARLRVVAGNERARRFYGARGWIGAVSYPHEMWGFAMLEMTKELAA